MDPGTSEDVPVLKDVSLRAEPGQTIALVGPTGAGKTSIASLRTVFANRPRGAGASLTPPSGSGVSGVSCIRNRP